jgi:hypothetical protein
MWLSERFIWVGFKLAVGFEVSRGHGVIVWTCLVVPSRRSSPEGHLHNHRLHRHEIITLVPVIQMTERTTTHEYPREEIRAMMDFYDGKAQPTNGALGSHARCSLVNFRSPGAAYFPSPAI